MAISNELRQHAEELHQATGVTVELVEEGGRIFVLLHNIPLPSALFKLGSTDVLYVTDQQYPFSTMDMFWTEVDVLCPDGSIPQNADIIETYLGRQWRRFSWHRNGVWNPARNGLLDHFAFMEARWTAEARR